MTINELDLGRELNSSIDAPSVSITRTGLHPTFDRILVERLPEETMSKGGIVLPDQSVTKPTQGTIVKLGPLVVAFAVGQTVMFGSYSGIDMLVDDHRYVLLKQDEITAILTQEPV